MEFKGYTLNFTVNNKTIDFAPEDVHVELCDSLFSILPTGKLQYNDFTSILHEYKVFMNGISLQIDYGSSNENSLLSTKWLVDAGEGLTNLEHGVNSYDNVHKLIHPSIGDLNTSVQCYETTPDAVLSEVYGSLTGIESVESSESAPNTKWFCVGKNQLEFINEILYKNSVNPNAPNSPMFLWVTSNGVLHFEDWDTIKEKQPLEEFVFRTAIEENTAENLLSTCIPLTENFTSQQKSFSHVIESLSCEDYAPTSEVCTFIDRISDDPTLSGVIPTQAEYVSLKTIDVEAGVSLQKTQANINFKTRKALMSESYLIRTIKPYTNLHSGDKIRLSVMTQGQGGISESLYASGDYIIENSRHIWDRASQSGVSEFIVSRDSSIYPATHKRSSSKLA